MILLVGALSVQYQSPGDCGVCVERGAESVAEFGSCWRAQAVQCSAVQYSGCDSGASKSWRRGRRGI